MQNAFIVYDIEILGVGICVTDNTISKYKKDVKSWRLCCGITNSMA